MNDFVTSCVFPGKTNALVKNIMKAMGTMDPNEAVNSFNRGEWVLTKVAEAIITFLESFGEVVIEVTEPIDLDAFFETKPGLWVHDSFKKMLVTTRSKFVPKSFSLSKYVIKKDGLFDEVLKELPANHVFEAKDFFPMLATMIQKQWGGKVGDLNMADSYNIFCVRLNGKKQLFKVHVHWFSNEKYWFVNAFNFGGRRVVAKSTIFAYREALSL